MRTMFEKLKLAIRLLTRLSGPDVIAYLKARRQRKFGSGTSSLGAKCLAHSITCRNATSDFDVFHQLIIGPEYDCLDGVRDWDLVIDCGANIGISAACFLSKSPTCKVISLEPDAANFALLKKNLAPYGDRWEGHRAALWENSCDALELHCEYRDGREWSRAVRVATSDTPEVIKTLTLAEILDMHPGKQVSLLKIDIEGAELNVFRSNVAGWIHRIERILIELHDEQCERTFHAAVPDDSWKKTRAGDMWLCERRKWAAVWLHR